MSILVDIDHTEQNRIQQIDEFACFCDAETVRQAKYGPTACTAQEMLMREARKIKNRKNAKAAAKKAVAQYLSTAKG